MGSNEDVINKMPAREDGTKYVVADILGVVAMIVTLN